MTLVLHALLFGLGLATFTSAVEEASSALSTNDVDHKADHTDSDLDKRLYDFGLGKRAYSYVSEYKRLPVYNFGLGKRSPRYDFGLGKRSETEDSSKEYDDYQYGGEDDEDDEEEEQIPEIDLYEDEDMQDLEKRQRLYNFGLGKRAQRYDFGLGKRAQRYDFGLGKRATRYDFGLGKRAPRYDFGLGKRATRYDFGLGKRAQRYDFGLGKRERLYNFGLGKRSGRLYSFGLGKRPSDRGMQSRFNFGLGKRSAEDTYPEESNIFKRDINEHNHEDNNSAETDFAHPAAESAEKQNETAHVDSHEIMGHSDRSHSHVAKRSVQPYDFGLGKRVAYQYPLDSTFSREFRRPLYNFGLGKRIPMYDFGLGKRSYEE